MLSCLRRSVSLRAMALASACFAGASCASGNWTKLPEGAFGDLTEASPGWAPGSEFLVSLQRRSPDGEAAAAASEYPGGEFLRVPTPRDRETPQATAIPGTGNVVLWLAPGPLSFASIDSDGRPLGLRVSNGANIAISRTESRALEIGIGWMAQLNVPSLTEFERRSPDIGDSYLMCRHLVAGQEDEWFGVDPNGHVWRVDTRAWTVRDLGAIPGGYVQGAAWDGERAALILVRSPNVIQIVECGAEFARLVRSAVLPTPQAGFGVGVSEGRYWIPVGDERGEVVVVDRTDIERAVVMGLGLAGRVRVSVSPAGDVVGTCAWRRTAAGRFTATIRVWTRTRACWTPSMPLNVEVPGYVSGICVSDHPTRVVLTGKSTYVWRAE